MNWFRENRWLGTFLIVFAICTIVVLYFLFSSKSAFEAAAGRFNEVAAERNRLQHLDPFPSEANFKKMQQGLQDYGAALNQLKEELKKQALAVAPLAPNEFQTGLRQTSATTADKAKANRVKFPDNFHLGFDEFTAALPTTEAAPLLGQELAQIDLLMSILIDARVDALTAFKRTPLPEEKAVSAQPTPAGRKPTGQTAAGPKMLERAIVDLTFTSSPSAARKVLNQIATSNQQFFIIRSLHVRNEQEKGPARETAATGAGTAASETGAPAGTKPASTNAIKFIVGNEHVETTMRIEIVRFTF
jgi:hypothetical protein